jgi:hypothetical protein
MRTKNPILRCTLISVGLGLGLSVGCLEVYPNLNHCSHMEGNASCEAKYAGERPFCNWGENKCGPTPGMDGCLSKQPANTCYSPCGGSVKFAEDSSCLDATTGSSDEGVSTDTSGGSTMETDAVDTSDSSTTGPLPCGGNNDCTDPAAPICDPVSAECVTCAATADPDGACAGLDPGAPLCIAGDCVQCTAENPTVCDEQLLLCDAASNACVSCVAHDECASGGCELAAGQCFPAGDVLHVDGDGGADYTTVTAAVGAVSDGNFAVIVVHEQNSGLGYPGATIAGGKTIALLGAPGELASIQGIGANPGLQVTEAGTVAYVDGMEISNAAVEGVVVDGAFAWIDRSRVVGNDGGGILVQNDAELTLRNCFVGGNIDTTVLEVQGATVSVLYTTLGASLGTTTSLTCDAGAMASVRNSLIVSRSDDDEVTCGNLDVTYTATEMRLTGMGNVDLGAMQTTWFQNFNAGDFHLTTAPIGIATTALWEAGDPPTDIDGDERRTTDGATDFAGADRP